MFPHLTNLRGIPLPKTNLVIRNRDVFENMVFPYAIPYLMVETEMFVILACLVMCVHERTQNTPFVHQKYQEKKIKTHLSADLLPCECMPQGHLLDTSTSTVK